jgi:hypothetical protein
MLALDHVAPVGRVRVLEVRHEAAGAGVQRVDDHLPARRPGYLHPPVLKRVGDRGDGEFLWRPDELERLARVQARLNILARVEKLPAAPVQLLVEPGYERESFGGQGCL